ncbi:MAG: S8 family serine peptidase [Synergistaceae bacterium]|nr:S8 family serine peptidase [Synergistaceae bacterium]
MSVNKKWTNFAGLVLIGVILLVLYASSALSQPTVNAARGDYAPGEVLVVLKNRIGRLNVSTLSSAAGTSYVKSASSSVGAKAVTTYAALSEAGNGIFVLMRSETKSTEELLTELEKNPDVECASPNYRVYADTTPNDPYFDGSAGNLWGLKKIRANEAWETTTGSDSVYVAVADTGVYYEHADLASNVDMSLSRSFVNSENNDTTPVESHNFGDDNGHGTHVAGTIAAVGNNGIGVVGVNWNTKILALKVLDEDGVGYYSWVTAGIDYLLKLLKEKPDLRVVAFNFSLGGWMSPTPDAIRNSAMWRAYKLLDQTDRTVIVVASGNEGHEVGAPAPYSFSSLEIAQGDYCYPSSYTGLNNMLVVGAIDVNDNAGDFANWSSKSVHLAAPGVNIWSTYSPLATDKPGLYKSSSGTSMATPHVAGAVALIASFRPELGAHQLKLLLNAAANRNINPTSPGKQLGREIPPQNVVDKTLSKYGLLDVKTALDADLPASVPVSSIVVLPTSPALTLANTVQLYAILEPEEATDIDVTWSSSSADVATVDSMGLVTAHTLGTTVITASASGGTDIFKSMSITVREFIPDPDNNPPARPANQPPTGSGGGGGGCDTGIGAFVFILGGFGAWKFAVHRFRFFRESLTTRGSDAILPKSLRKR